MVDEITKLLEALAAGPQAMEMLGRFQTPEAAQAANASNPRLAAQVKSSGSPEEKPERTPYTPGTQWDNGKRSVTKRGGGGGTPLVKHGAFDAAAILAQLGEAGPMRALGASSTNWSKTQTPGVNPVEAAFSQIGARSGALGDRAASRRVSMGPVQRGGFGDGIKPATPNNEYSYNDRLRDRKWAAQDAADADRRLMRRINLLRSMIGNDLTEREVVDDEQYVNNAGRWDKKPTRRVTTRSGGIADIIRMLGA